MTASLAGLLPLSVLEPDGLIVTTDGRYVRMIECERVPNALTADPVTLGAIERAYANVCRTIPDHQGIVVYAQTDPVPLKEALEADLELTEAAADADRAAGHHALAGSRERLLEATTQTVLAAAGAEQPAVAARWWVAVPYSPRLETARDQLRSLAARSRGRTLWSTHREAAIESARVSAQIEAALRAAGIETYPLDGTQTLALLWERLHPATDSECDLDRARRRLPSRDGHDGRGGTQRASRAVARGVRRRGVRDRRRRGRGLAASRRRHARGGSAPRIPTGPHRCLVALAPAVLPAAGNARRAHRSGRPGAGAGAAAPPVEAASRSGALQGTARPRRRLGRAGGARGGRQR